MPTAGPDNPNGWLPDVLYDDGTNSGVTIYMQAVTTNTLATSGYGEFYNPKYNDQTTYNNTDGTGLYRIWDGDNPDPLDVPVYEEGDIVFWGGYAWENLLGNVGTAVTIVELNSIDWEKIPYSNTTWYEKAIDEIKVDWNNGIVVERYNPENQIRVAFNPDQYSWWVGFESINSFGIKLSPISAICWGLYSKVTPEQLDNNFYGISNIEAINSPVDLINFRGSVLVNLYCNLGYFARNYIGKNASISEINISQWGDLSNNVIIDNSSITEITIVSSSIAGNYVYSNSQIRSSNLIHFSNINGNILTNSYIRYCNLTQCEGFGINENTLTNGNIQNNILSNGSRIQQNILTNGSSIYLNTLDNSSIYGNILNNAYIERNTSSGQSFIDYNELSDDSSIRSNTVISSVLTNSNLTGSNTGIIANYFYDSELALAGISSGIVTSNYFNGVNANADYTSATHIFAYTYTKNIISRPDGTARIIYYDNSNVLQNVAVNS